MGRADDLLPLTPRVFLILWGLADGPKHGYRLLQVTEELGRGRVSIGPASLYEALQTLRDRGLIEEVATPGDEDARRRTFQLTRDGRALLEAEAGRLAALVDDLRRDGLAASGGDA